MMMGTAGELPKEPVQPTKFLEDMTDAEVSEAVRVFIYFFK
jgi:ubiquitin carboxyl-terminal hydrolase 14